MITDKGYEGKYEVKEINANELAVRITLFNKEGIPVATAHEAMPHFIENKRVVSLPIILKVVENDLNIDMIYIDLN